MMLLLVALGCGGKRKYDAGLLQIANGFAAKEACSCVFVMGRDEEFCSEWVRVSPDVARFQVDREQMQVTSRALGMAKRTAAFTKGQGCRLVD